MRSFFSVYCIACKCLSYLILLVSPTLISEYVCVSELMFLETSALTGENVEEAFVQCARKILNKIDSGGNP